MKLRLFITLLFLSISVQAQEAIEPTLKKIYQTALLEGQSYPWLAHLSNQIGGRLSGSLNARRAVQCGKEELEDLDLDRDWLQLVMVPK